MAMKLPRSLTEAFDLSVSTLAGIKKIHEVEIRMQVIEKMLQLQQRIQTAQQDVFALQNENLTLAEENKALRKEKTDWQHHLQEAELYELRQLAPDVCAYIKRDAGDDLKQAQKLCKPCFEQGIHSTFNFVKRDFHEDTLSCHQCGLHIRVPNGVEMECLTETFSNKMDGFI